MRILSTMAGHLLDMRLLGLDAEQLGAVALNASVQSSTQHSAPVLGRSWKRCEARRLWRTSLPPWVMSTLPLPIRLASTSS